MKQKINLVVPWYYNDISSLLSTGNIKGLENYKPSKVRIMWLKFKTWINNGFRSCPKLDIRFGYTDKGNNKKEVRL